MLKLKEKFVKVQFYKQNKVEFTCDSSLKLSFVRFSCAVLSRVHDN